MNDFPQPDLPEIPLGKMHSNPADDLPEIPTEPSGQQIEDLLKARGDAYWEQLKVEQARVLTLETEVSFFKRENELLKDKVVQERAATYKTAVMLMPILTQYLLQRGAQGMSGLLPCGDVNERNARELLRSFQQLVAKINAARKKPT